MSAIEADNLRHLLEARAVSQVWWQMEMKIIESIG